MRFIMEFIDFIFRYLDNIALILIAFNCRALERKIKKLEKEVDRLKEKNLEYYKN